MSVIKIGVSLLLKVVTLVVDSAGAVYPFFDISQELINRGVELKMYVTSDLTIPETFEHTLYDDFDTTKASEDHQVFSAEDSAIKLLWESRKIIGSWIPHIVNTLLHAIETGELDPENTVVIGNSPTFLYLGHFLLAHGFKGFIVLEPYRMVDWLDAWHEDEAQMIPAHMPWLARLLFSSHGHSLTKQYNNNASYDYSDIRKAVIAHAHLYSPLLCEDKHLALGYPYPLNTAKKLPENILAFIDNKKQLGQKIFVLTLGSMQISAIKQQEMIDEFIKVVHQQNASAIILGTIANCVQSDDSVLAIDDFVPYNSLFPEVDLIFHHHGAGTVHLALVSGTPTYAITFLPDQSSWAIKLRNLGISVGNSSAKNFNAGTVIQDIQENFTPLLIQKAKEFSALESKEGLEAIGGFIVKNI